MRISPRAIAIATLFAAMLALPQVAGASSGTPDLELSLVQGGIFASQPELPGQLGLSWKDVGSAPIAGTTTVILTLPEGMTTEGAEFEDTCSPYSECKSASETVASNRRTLTFTYVGEISVGQSLGLKVLYLPGIELSHLAMGSITATVSNSTDPNASDQTSYQVGVESPAEKEAEAKAKEAREKEAKAKEAKAKEREAEAKAKEARAKEREAETKARETKAKEKEAREKEARAKEREAEENEAREREREAPKKGRTPRNRN
jgi:flagellar biosynthesis GTPase FlhF